MQRISSAGTLFSKRVFPAVFLVLALYFAVDLYRTGSLASDPLMLGGLGLMVAIGVFVFRFFVWDLADEVFDHGTYLEVRRGKIVDQVAFSNIVNVRAIDYANPPRITLRLEKPGALGEHVSFSPKVPLSFRPFAKSTIVDELAERAAAARPTST